MTKHMNPTKVETPDLPELRAILGAELEAAAAVAPPAEEPLYRWLTQLADDVRMLPLHNRKPNLVRIAAEMRLTRASCEKFVDLLAEWQPRFQHAIYGEPEPQFPDGVIAEAKRTGINPGQPNADLVAELEAAKADAAERDLIVYDWLIARAAIGATIPGRGGAPNLKEIHRLMGVSYHRTMESGDLLRRWFPRFTPAAMGWLKRRDVLPGCDAAGTEVPVDMLIEGLQGDLTAAMDADEARLLRHLIKVASGDRTLPRFKGQPAITQILRDAELDELKQYTPARKRLDERVAFFHVAKEQTQTLIDGSLDVRKPPHVAVAEFIEELRGLDPEGLREPTLVPLRKSPRGHTLSYVWVSEQINVKEGALRHGKARELLEAYWSEAGAGEAYRKRSSGTQRMLNARRRVLLDHVKKCVKDGIPLPRAKRPGSKLDYDELVRRSGSPGPNLADDDWFKTQVRKLAPKYEQYSDRGGVPKNYAQLVDGFVAEAVRATTNNASRASAKTKAERAVRLYREALGKHHASEIGDDFEPEPFKRTLALVEASGRCGKQCGNWKSEIRRARTWFFQRQNDDMLGDTFDTVLRAAYDRDGRTLAEILDGIGLDNSQVVAWMRGDALPSKEAIPMLPELSVRLGLDEDRLGNLLSHNPLSRGHVRGSVTIPPGVHEFLPDNWTTLKPDQQAAIVQWIDDNLVHTNTLFGHTMRDVAKRRNEGRKAEETEQVKLDEDSGGPDDETPVHSEMIDQHLDSQLTDEATGLGKAVAAELLALRTHMTVNFPQHYLRRPKSKWQLASTAPMKLAMIIRFLKWQTLPEDLGGLGRSPEDLTLADLVNPPLLFAFLDYKARSLEHVEFKGVKRGKVFTGTEVDLLKTARSLVSAEYGLITQRPELAERVVADERPLPAGSFISLSGHVYDEEENKNLRNSEKLGLDGSEALPAQAIMPPHLCDLNIDEFRDACRRAELAYASAQSHVDEEADMIRDPTEAIQPILDSEQPMTTLLRQLALASKRTPNVTERPLQHHLHVRDLLMARMLAVTALRSRNLREITVGGAQPKLTFMKNEKGDWRWHLQIHWREFKNYRSAVLFGRVRKRQPYRKWLEDSHGLYRLIDYYVQVSRPYLLLQGKRRSNKRGDAFKPVEEMFVTSTGNSLSRDEMWRAIRLFGARHIAWNPFRDTGVPMCMPFGPHAYRDIRATDILLNPETANPFLEAAYALQTSPAMIQNHYGVVKVERRTAMDDVSFRKREDLAFAGMDDDEGAGLPALPVATAAM